jgi:hypothetical protein
MCLHWQQLGAVAVGALYALNRSMTVIEQHGAVTASVVSSQYFVAIACVTAIKSQPQHHAIEPHQP